MNIAILTSSFPRYSSDSQGNFIWHQARGQAERGNVVHVICPHVPGTPFYEVIDGITVHRFPYFYPYRLQRLTSETGMYSALRQSFLAVLQLPLFFLCQWYCALQVIRQQGIDLVHTHWLVPQGFVGVFLCWINGTPHITTVHGSDVNTLKEYLILHHLCRFITRHSTVITVNSSYMKRQLLSVSSECEKKIRIIPMGVDTGQYNASLFTDMKQRHSAGHIILSIGRLIDWKGTEFLIGAMPVVLEKCPDAKLLIIGSGPERDTLIRKVYDLGISDRVEFLGIIPAGDLLLYYRFANVFVLPSIVRAGQTEGLGIVLLEAMASGCPVIGSNVGGIPDVITDGQNGFLVPEQNSEMLAEKIVTLLSDEDLAEKFRQRGYEIVLKRFSWEEISRQFSLVYVQIMGNTTPSGDFP